MTLCRAKAEVVDGDREDRREERGAEQNERLRVHGESLKLALEVCRLSACDELVQCGEIELAC